MANAWYRFYVETLDDAKVQKLPGDRFKGWVNLLTLAAKNEGFLPPIEDVAFALRISDDDARELVDFMVEKELFDKTKQGITAHNWEGRQYKSDVSTDRVKRFRKRQRNAKGNKGETPKGTPPDTEQIQNRTPTGEKPPPPEAKKPEPDAATPPNFWDVGVGMGIPRSMIGKWIKENTETKVAECIAHMAIKRPADPVQFGTAWLQERPKKLYVPKVDDELWPWAKANGFPDPGQQESYESYRQRLWGMVNQRNAA